MVFVDMTPFTVDNKILLDYFVVRQGIAPRGGETRYPTPMAVPRLHIVAPPSVPTCTFMGVRTWGQMGPAEPPGKWMKN